MKIKRNVLLDIKYIFLNFAQALFADHYFFTWDADIQKTKIIIADRNAIDLGVAVKRPSIILQRGEVSWAYVTRGQDGTNVGSVNSRGLVNISGYSGPTMANVSSFKHFTDLLRGYVVFNVISKNGVQAEIIADHLFTNITGQQDFFRSLGVRQITNLTVGQEQIIKNSADVELAGVQVSFAFTMQLHIVRDEKTYNCYVFSDNNEDFENHNYLVINNGTAIKFIQAPEDPTTVKIDYTDALTLASRTGVAMLQTSNPLVFLIPNNEAIAGFYKLFEHMIITEDQIDEKIHID